MPNWCANRLRVQSECKSEIERFVETFNKQPNGPLFDLNECVKYPEKCQQMDEERWGTTADGYNSGGYGWRIAHWGTKWNITLGSWSDVQTWYDHSKGADVYWVEVDFDSAWSPPIEAIIAWFDRNVQNDALTEEFTLRLDYCEPGMDFAGWVQTIDDCLEHGEIPVRESPLACPDWWFEQA